MVDKGNVPYKWKPYAIDNKVMNPTTEASKIIILYIVIGCLWILTSDSLLHLFITDNELIDRFQLFKGWFYVVVTAVVFYIIIRNRMVLYRKTIDQIGDAYRSLNETYQKLQELEQKLRQQYQISETTRQALCVSEQRYSLAVEGANDGIWDWDIKENLLFLSKNWFNYYSDVSKENGYQFDDFKKLIHPEDIAMADQNLNTYIHSYPEDSVFHNIIRIRRNDGEYRWILMRGKGVWDENGQIIRIAGSHTDITDQKNMEQQLFQLAYFDKLTGLPNRVMLEQTVSNLIRDLPNRKLAFLYIDIDNFKHINELMGHETGDILIKEIAQIFQELTPDPNMVARLGGDEYAILLTNVTSEQEIFNHMSRLFSSLRKSWSLGAHTFYISISIGVALYPNHGNNFYSLLKNADFALSYSKENGKNQISFYNIEMQKKTANYINLMNQVQSALDHNEFSLHFQPQIDLSNNEMIGAEALIRWYQPITGFYPPIQLIRFAEQTGFIKQIEQWVIKTALLQLKDWHRSSQFFKLAINISAKTLNSDTLVPSIERLLNELELEGHQIEVEITETAVMEDLNRSIETINKLKKLGISIALDDFGSGYSSLTYLQKLPIDLIKIDREFIMQNQTGDSHILKTIIDLAHLLGKKVLAEGVETKEQLSTLKQFQCDYAQGYYFSKPLPANDAVFFSKHFANIKS